MTKKEAWNRVNTDEKCARFLIYLRDRWADECKYEDINDYLDAVKSQYFPTCYAVTKRPFGYRIKCDDGDIHIVVKVRGNSAWFATSDLN